MKITNEQMVSILDELRPEKQQDGDVTISEAMEEWDVSKTNARDILENAVKEGKLIKINGVRFNDRKGMFHRRVCGKIDETI